MAGARRLVGEWVTVDELLQRIRGNVVFFDQSGGGVTFSGGEPLMQHGFLFASLRLCKSEGIHTAVETCGFGAPEVVTRISEYVDLFLFDLKLAEADRHRQFTGVDNALILNNLCMLVRNGISVVVRIPVISGVNDDESNLRGSMALLAKVGVQRVDLLPYHEIGVDKYQRLGSACRLPEVRTPSAERMLELSDWFSREGFTVRIGG